MDEDEQMVAFSYPVHPVVDALDFVGMFVLYPFVVVSFALYNFDSKNFVGLCTTPILKHLGNLFVISEMFST